MSGKQNLPYDHVATKLGSQAKKIEKIGFIRI